MKNNGATWYPMALPTFPLTGNDRRAHHATGGTIDGAAVVPVHTSHEPLTYWGYRLDIS